jgi:hypothetical protein
VYPQMQEMAPAWGWTQADLDELQDRLTVASRNAGGKAYTAALSETQHNGALVSAAISVDTTQAQVDATFRISSLE